LDNIGTIGTVEVRNMPDNKIQKGKVYLRKKLNKEDRNILQDTIDKLFHLVEYKYRDSYILDRWLLEDSRIL